MSTKHAEHDHTHGMAKQTLRLAFFLSLIIVAAEVGGGLLAHSLALLSDAGHALTDIFALGLAWFATAQAERPANARKTFGYHPHLFLKRSLPDPSRASASKPSRGIWLLLCGRFQQP